MADASKHATALNSSSRTTPNQSNNDISMYRSNDPIVDFKLQSTNSTREQNNLPEVKVGPKHPTTYLETTLHLFKSNIGSGLYALGDAFKNAGIVLAPIATVVLGIISVHSQHLLLTGSTEIQTRLGLPAPPDFAGTVELCFATGPQKYRKFSVLMRRLVNLFLCITQLGFCCVYFVFISTNIKKICDQYGFVISIHIHLLIALVPILLSCLIRNLKYLTPISTIANLFMAIGLAAIIYFASSDIPPLSERKKIADLNQLPLFFGSVIYAFEAIGLTLPLRNEMKEPEKFQKTFGVLNVGMAFIITLYVVIGFLGYAKWGESVLGSLTLNLPENNILSIVVQSLIALGILFTYPLQFYVVVDITWPTIQRKIGLFKNPIMMELIYRSLLVFLTFVLAAVIPHLSLFISLVGAVSSTALALIFPAIIELMTKSQNTKGVPWWIATKNTIIITVGLVGFATGTFESIKSLVAVFYKSDI